MVTARRYLNISQEYQDNLSDLRALDLIDRAKISTNEGILVAYKITFKGKQIEIPNDIQEKIDNLIACPKCGIRLNVNYDMLNNNNQIQLYCRGKNCNYIKNSGITQIEDVSYHSRPYFPQVYYYHHHQTQTEERVALHYIDLDLISDIEQKHQEKMKYSTFNIGEFHTQKNNGNILIPLKQNLFATNPRILICEFIPFGRNLMVDFNQKLDIFKRVKENLIGRIPNHKLRENSVELNPFETIVSLISIEESEYSYFITEMYAAEAKEIIQKEALGVSISQYGRVLIGIDLQKVEDQQKKASFDYIPRIFTDISFDCSRFLDNLLAEHQRILLNTNYVNQMLTRQKYYILIADKLIPDLNPPEYLESGHLEAEIKQVLEYAEGMFTLSNQTKIFIGSTATIVSGGQIRELEPVLAHFAFIRGVNLFIINFFKKIHIISRNIKEVQQLTNEFIRDPRTISQAQVQLAKINAECILMNEISHYMKDALQDGQKELIETQVEYTPIQKELTNKMDLEHHFISITERVDDLEKLVNQLLNDAKNGQNQIAVIQEKRLQQIFRSIKQTGQIQRRTQKISERQEDKMGILEMILSGSLAFEILSLIVGEYTFSDSADPNIFGIPVNSPVLWFVLNVILWFVMVFGILRLMKWMTKKAEDILTVTVNFDRPIRLEKLDAWIAKHDLLSTEAEHTEDRVVRTANLSVHLEGKEFTMTLEYDEQNEFLYGASMDIEKPGSKTKQYYANLLETDFTTHGVFIIEEF
jgi:WD repeat-containing protein 35